MAVNTEEKQDTILTERNLQILAELRLMDDEFFSEALDGKTEAVAYILNTILGRTDLKVKHTASQVEYKSVVRRSIKLDINSIWIQGEAPCIFSVENVVTGSKLCSGNLTDLCCCINVWKSRADSAGPEISWK